MRLCHVLRHTRQAEAGQCRTESLHEAVENELAIDSHLQLAVAFFKLPGVQTAIRRQAQIDAVVVGQVLWLLWWGSLREIRPGADDRHTHVRADTNCNHVLRHLLAETHTCVIPLSDDVGQTVKVLGTDVWDFSYAEWESRRQMRQILAFLRRYVPGFEKAYAVQSGVNIGVRETRRFRRDYQLTADDILQARKFADVVARSAYPVNIHNPEGSGTLLKRVPPGKAYDIPLRCLMPQNVVRLIVAGRCISGTHEAHSSYCVLPVSMATGQAAGACAALAVRLEKFPRSVAVADVQRELIRQGADLGGVR